MTTQEWLGKLGTCGRYWQRRTSWRVGCSFRWSSWQCGYWCGGRRATGELAGLEATLEDHLAQREATRRPPDPSASPSSPP
jgi:hypothetical protein